MFEKVIIKVNENRKGQNGENIVNREHKDENITPQRTVSKYQGFLLTSCLRRDFTEDTDVTCVQVLRLWK